MDNNELLWINPIGGLGDTLMISGVLKQVSEREPDRRFALVRRTSYLSILKDHPAIDRVGFPPENAAIMGTDYWSREELGSGEKRAYQVLARMFGLPTPADERLYLPGGFVDDEALHSLIPRAKETIIIAPFSESPRKVMHPSRWHALLDMLKGPDRLIIQVGRKDDLHIRNAYSLIGLTSPRQLVSLLRKSQLVITADNFIMHAACLASVPAVVLWGPTSPEVYGYPGQYHIRALPDCSEKNDCLGPGKPDNYPSHCPHGERQCLNRIDLNEIAKAAGGYRLWSKEGKSVSFS
ncbi:MAG: glycosyltransferase family 9 protein [Vulcanimicrobiota bacterium]